MNMLLRTTAIALLLALAGCATPYAANGLTGGYKNEQLDPHTWRVSFQGNGFTTSDMVWNYWIYRCAELTRQSGFEVFVVRPNAKTSDLEATPRFLPATLRDGDEGVQLVKTHGGGGGGYHYVYTPGYGGTITTYSKTTIVQMYLEADMFAPRPAVRAQVILDMLKPYVDSSGKVAAPSRMDILKKATVNSLQGIAPSTTPKT
ncbi:MAG TPA: hypothetical protein VGH80_01685 [Xanthomonadaceae bacterium]|jgi:hypothetical protein